MPAPDGQWEILCSLRPESRLSLNDTDYRGTCSNRSPRSPRSYMPEHQVSVSSPIAARQYHGRCLVVRHHHLLWAAREAGFRPGSRPQGVAPVKCNRAFDSALPPGQNEPLRLIRTLNVDFEQGTKHRQSVDSCVQRDQP